MWKIKHHVSKNTCKKSLKIPKGGNQNVYIEEDQTTQWPKEKRTKVQKDKQQFTKHTHKTKDRVTCIMYIISQLIFMIHT